MSPDPNSPILSQREAQVLHRLSAKRLYYIAKGQGREAHAMAMAMQIVWDWICEPPVLDYELPMTQPGDL